MLNPKFYSQHIFKKATASKDLKKKLEDNMLTLPPVSTMKTKNLDEFRSRPYDQIDLDIIQTKERYIEEILFSYLS